MNILNRAQEIQDQVVEWRRYIHSHPELGLNLPGTATYVKARLTEMGYTPQDCGQCGVTATVGGKKGGKCILLRADMDALPMREDSGLPFASTCDMAHTCGHDMHAAMLLGAAKILKEMEDELPGTVKLMFQPGEEILAGAASMLQDGLLESPNVDAVLAQHVSSALPSGKIAYNVGGFASSADAIVITIKGKGCHGASPNEGIDPVVIASHVIIGLMEINAREVNPAETVVLTFGSVNSGSKNNILPDTAVITGTLRSYNSQVRNYVKERIAQISQGIAAAYRAEAVVEYPYGCPPLVADKSIMDTVGQGIKDCIGEDLVMDDMPRSNGSEDFGYVTELCKGGMIYLGTDPGDRGTPYPHHTEKVYFDEAAMANGVAAYVAAALAWLDKNQ